ncbi:DUF2972 domain-containing protein [Campylobacter sp. MIT 21-1685]|uniref:DUF2972 domain-containing protein n=1 Tax=unclassified Campylobacter TaxID=2593542 RepID=UPI00224B22BF|nr:MULTISPECIES: DUF2972 domain-containing protein [unclassified Campylobacter]MCX2682338.1 DUF2972 domain-containing protein [Campylobacter sp. MIT 21-1684]MCX2750618.1 DUF2972 domain-containing protein [Campylobacter sp. MIT 21-1682]MCX2806834.1 DUF2972 domain-containing protein [Campylobacter sp. MIT 21-1685]
MQITTLFPNLSYPNLQKCKDYKEATVYYTHLSFFLGQALIECHKNWYKGGYLHIFSKFKKAKKHFLYLNHLKQKYSPYLIADLFNTFTIEDTKRFFALVEKWAHYEALSKTLIKNAQFVIEHFENVNSWLESKEFEHTYQKQFFAYPPLLNPQTLENIKEKLHYKNIPTNLAWDLNLPLPKALCICIGFSFSGHWAFTRMLNKCKITNSGDHKGIDAKWHYETNYKLALENKNHCYNIFLYTHNLNPVKALHKFICMLRNDHTVICLTRDPFSRIKSGLNNQWKIKNCNDHFNTNTALYEFLLQRTHFWLSHPSLPLNTRIEKLIKWHLFCLNTILDLLCNLEFSNFLFIDTKELEYPKVDTTMQKIASKLDVKLPKDTNAFNISFPSTYYGTLPAVFTSNDICIYIESTPRLYTLNAMLNINTTLLPKEIYFNTEEKNLHLLECNQQILKEIKEKLCEFTQTLFQFYNDTKTNEKELLNQLQEKKELSLELGELLKKEFEILSRFRPDIINSWRYYQEFLKNLKEY